MHNDSHFAGKWESTGTSSKSGGKSQQSPREGSSDGKEVGGKGPNIWMAKSWPNTFEYPPEYRKVMCVCECFVPHVTQQAMQKKRTINLSLVNRRHSVSVPAES